VLSLPPSLSPWSITNPTTKKYETTENKQAKKQPRRRLNTHYFRPLKPSRTHTNGHKLELSSHLLVSHNLTHTLSLSLYHHRCNLTSYRNAVQQKLTLATEVSSLYSGRFPTPPFIHHHHLLPTTNPETVHEILPSPTSCTLSHIHKGKAQYCATNDEHRVF
jgi:hypothetical protein